MYHENGVQEGMEEEEDEDDDDDEESYQVTDAVMLC